MRWILTAGITVLLMACAHSSLRCDGSLQPINVEATPSSAPSTPASGAERTP